MAKQQAPRAGLNTRSLDPDLKPADLKSREVEFVVLSAGKDFNARMRLAMYFVPSGVR
jgi:hypothetical protein